MTARSTPGASSRESRRPASARRSSASCRGRGRASPTSTWTKFVSTSSRSTGRPRVRPAFGEPPRAGVVVGEPLDVVVERVEPGGRDDPGLAHRAAEAVLLDPRAAISSARAGDQRAERAAEPLREAERDGVGEAPRSRAGGDAGARRPRSASRAPSRWTRRPSSRAVATTARELLERPDGAAGAVVRVLERDDRRARRVEARPGPRGRAHLLGREPARGSRAARASAARSGCAAPPSSATMMCAVSSTISSVAALAEDRERDLVRHRRRRQVDGLLVPEQRRAAPLELEHGRVLALLLVADLGARHRLAHRRATASSACRSGGRSRTRADGYRGRVDLDAARDSARHAASPPTAPARCGSGRRAAPARYAEMTNLPAALRAALDERGAVLDARARARGARRATARVKALFQHARRPPGRGGADALPRRPPLGVRLVAVGLPADVHVLRDRADAVRPQPDGRGRSSTRRCTSAGSSRSTTLVFMGMGEPMLNLDAVLAAARRLPDLGITHRRTTISTVGWLPGLRAVRRRGRGADPARALAARRRRRAAQRADAGQRPLSARRRARRVPPLLRAPPPQGVRRVRDARRRQRPARSRPAELARLLDPRSSR